MTSEYSKPVRMSVSRMEAAITDPFTGQPFIYRVEGDNMLVYSVGFDREDGGGVPRGVDGRRDVVWRIARGSAAR